MKKCDKRHKHAKLDALCQSRHCAGPCLPLLQLLPSAHVQMLLHRLWPFFGQEGLTRPLQPLSTLRHRIDTAVSARVLVFAAPHMQLICWLQWKAAVSPCCSRHVRFDHSLQRVLQTPLADLLPLRATLVAARSSWQQCMLLSERRSVRIFASSTSFLPCQHFVGYMGIIFPVPDGKGTERT